MRLTTILTALLCLLACHDAPPSTAKMFPVPGLGVIHYNTTQLASSKARAVAADLLAVKDAVWPEYERIYGGNVQYHLDTIRLDANFYKVAELSVNTGRMVLNPTMNYRRGFAAELHNLYRYFHVGITHIYCHEAVSPHDEQQCHAAQAVWQGV
jgi:hypothetical protein